MNIVEKEVVENKKVYEFTEDEYIKLIKETYVEGMNDLMDYIIFCLKNDGLTVGFDWSGIMLKRIVDFLKNNIYMENKYKICFNEYVKKYKNCGN